MTKLDINTFSVICFNLEHALQYFNLNWNNCYISWINLAINLAFYGITSRCQFQISSTFYIRLFHTKVLHEAFLWLEFGFVIFWRKNIVEKAACKMLMTLMKLKTCFAPGFEVMCTCRSSRWRGQSRVWWVRPRRTKRPKMLLL